MKSKRSSGRHFVASISHRKMCAGRLVAVCAGLAGPSGPGSSALQEQSWWGGDEVRAREPSPMEGGAAGRGGGGGRTAGDVHNEELDDANHLAIEKVRRATYRTDFSEGSLCCWTPRECLRGTTNPGIDARDPPPGRWSFSNYHITQRLRDGTEHGCAFSATGNPLRCEN